MAAVAPAPAPDQAADFIQKISLEPQTNAKDSPEAANKASSGNQQKPAKGAFSQSERSATPFMPEYMDPNMWAYPPTTYFCGGYDGSIAEWEEYPGFYTDMYHHGYGYASYAPYPSSGSPAPAIGHDGHMYGPQQYQFPDSYYKAQTPANALKVAKQDGKPKDISTSEGADQPPISVEPAKANSNGASKGSTVANNGSTKVKGGQQIPSFAKGVQPGGISSYGYQDPRFGFDAMWSPVAWYSSAQYPDVQRRPAKTNFTSSTASHVSDTTASRNSSPHSLPQYLGAHQPSSGVGSVTPGIMNRTYSTNKMNSQTSSAYRNGFGYGSGYDSRMSSLWWPPSANKYMSGGRGYGSYNNFNKLDGLSELNKGPRTDRLRNQKGGEQPAAVSGKGQSPVGNVQDSTAIPDMGSYNKADFPETYADAKFFIIKSYSEDDVHKSVKYNVWASTSNGNKKLDSAYREAQEKYTRCPIFLFFSVNTSGQFLGVAEMVGPVDFNKTVEHWQQDKWTGCFPVNWHIVKDVPNSILKHIILENNENKPVTNSRDTQEVKLEQGLQMIKIFKEHVSKTSLLDDFSFYNDRQKVMQERRLKTENLPKKVMDGKPVDPEGGEKDEENRKPRLHLPLEAVTVLKKDGLAETVTIAGISSKDANSESEMKAGTNGVVNGV